MESRFMLTPAQAAAQLNLSASRLRAITEEGMIEAQRTPGGHRRYRPPEVARLQELFARTGTAGLPRLAKARPGAARDQLDELWQGAHSWIDRQCRPLVRQAYERIQAPDGVFRDAGVYAELAFAADAGRTQYFRYPWPSMLRVLALREQQGGLLLDVCQGRQTMDRELYYGAS